MAWEVQQGKPEYFTMEDVLFAENVEIARGIVQKSRSKAPRLVCMTQHGWGSCVHYWHMPAGTFYVEVYADGAVSDVKQVAPYRVSATEREIKEGRAELYIDPIDSRHISGIYENGARYVLKG